MVWYGGSLIISLRMLSFWLLSTLTSDVNERNQHDWCAARTLNLARALGNSGAQVAPLLHRVNLAVVCQQRSAPRVHDGTARCRQNLRVIRVAAAVALVVEALVVEAPVSAAHILLAIL